MKKSVSFGGGLKESLAKNEHIEARSELMETLKKAVPQFVDPAGGFKVDAFVQELNPNDIVEARDGYKLGFVGKDYARLQAGKAPETVLVPDNDHNVRPENYCSENIFLTGDNLEVLRHLSNAYERQVKVIYIDPPYNTGKEFVYSDKFEFQDEMLREVLGYTDEEIRRLKSIQGRSSHSAWLTFIYPRLKIAQKLLQPDGVIFVSIDDNEQANLKLLMNEIFGEGNFIGQIVWQTATDNNPTQIATEHEYVLCYVKDKSEHDAWEVPSDKGKIIQEKYEELKKVHQNDIETLQIELRKWIRKQANGDDLSGVSHYSYVDEQGVFYPGNAANTRPGGYTYDIVHPVTKKVCEKPEYGYRWKEETFWHANDAGNVLWGDDETIIPKIKKRLETATQKLKSCYYEDNRATTGDLKALFGGVKVFDNPKSLSFLKHIFRFTVGPNDWVMDFFAGSATTAHAIMQLNADDEGKRKFILVQIEEPVNAKSEAGKKGFKTIDQIARKRIQLAAQKIKTEKGLTLSKNFDSGFKHYRLVTPNVKTLEKIVEFNVNEPKLIEDDMVTPFGYEPTHTPGLDTLLTTWLIGDGFHFDTKVDLITFAKYTAQYVEESATLYLISLGWSHDALKALLNRMGKHELDVQTLIIYPYSFSFDALRALKTNIKANLDQSPTIIERY